MPFSAARVEVSRIRERAVRDERRRRVDRCFQMPVPAQHEEVRDVDEPLRLLAPPGRLELVQLGDVSTTAASPCWLEAAARPAARCGASARGPSARPEGAPVPPRQGLNLRWLLSLEIAAEVLQPRERLPVLCPVRPPLALDDVVDRAQREAVHLDRPAARPRTLRSRPERRPDRGRTVRLSVWMKSRPRRISSASSSST